MPTNEQPVWWRPRPTPQQTEPMRPPVWKPGQRPAQPPRRGPWQKLGRIALAVAITAHVAFAATPAQASVEDQSECHLNSGPQNASLGALLYVREVVDDAVIKYRDFQADPKKIGALERIEMDNDYLCDVPREYQDTLRFMTLNIIIYILDIMQM